MLVADGVFHASGAFTVAPAPDGKQIAKLFRHKELRMLLGQGQDQARAHHADGLLATRIRPRRWVQRSQPIHGLLLEFPSHQRLTSGYPMPF